MPPNESPPKQSDSFEITFRKPESKDGPAVWNLIRKSRVLDENSLYCNLLQCDHFRDTCIIAESGADRSILGWISAYLVPDDRDTLFIWQVAVDESVRGRGLAGQMLMELIARPECRHIRRLGTTITADNAASWALFHALARRMGAELSRRPHFRKDDHFQGTHATEHLVTISLPVAAEQAA